MPKPTGPERFLPLSQTHFHILASLAEGEKHGYALMKDIARRSEGRVTVAIGNLYVALQKLLEGGLIERAGEREEEGERRKFYRITGVGEMVLRDDVRRMQALIRTSPVPA